MMTGEEIPMGQSGSQWNSVHVYYYEQNKDALILDCVRPLFRDLSEEVDRAFFVRHWLRGPHLRLQFLAPEEYFSAVVGPAVEDRVSRYLKRYPSSAEVDESELLTLHSKLAKWEREPSPISPLHADNSIVRAQYDRRLHVLKSEIASELLEQFYTDTNGLAFAMLEHVRRGGDLMASCLDLMVATAHSMSLHVVQGAISYKSHAEGFVIETSNPQAARSFLDDKYASQSEALQNRVGRVISALEKPEEEIPFMSEWLKIANRFWGQVEPLVASGDLTADREGIEVGHAEAWMERTKMSDFHAALHASGTFDALQRDLWFRCYRIILNYLYLHLSRIGVRPLQRYTLCHLAAKSVEDLYQVSATAMVSQFSPGGGYEPQSNTAAGSA